MALHNEPIALIGSGCRFPGGATSPSRLWELLKSPRDLVKKVPKERFNIDGYYHPDGTHHGRTNAQHAYFLEEDPYAFDPGFFNISPNEVDTIDPQQRLLLETVYDSLLSAGLKMEDLRGSPTAVYVGLMQRDFLDNANYDMDALSTYAATGAAASILSNRVSYAFGWHGPSMTIDTACSSSLVAVHLAIQQLRTGASQVAVAAGSNLILGPTPFVTANGYARGEGIAAVVLKTLAQAIADGDTIECVIRESGVNQDGKTPGITMPSPAAQEALIRQVYEAAGLDVTKPEDRCQYFEAHGTGTQAGDPQEACAISSAFFGDRKRAEDEDPLYVGSIKTIIGHTEGTAGVAGLIKASQVIQHGILPPNMLFNELNPRVAPFYSDLQVVTKQQPWPALKFNQPRRVSVNSFGFGGTNAHVILESYVPSSRPSRGQAPSPCLAPIVLSANSTASLKAAMDDLKRSLDSQPELQLHDLAWTLLRKRSNLQVRHTIQAKNMPALREALEQNAPSVSGKQVVAAASDVKSKSKVLGIFTGQGAQWPAMGKSLISEVAYARSIISELDSSLQDLPAEYRPSWSLLDQLLLEGENSNVHHASYSQPLCCAVQIMLTKLLEAAGVTFTVVIGHSSGEIACAFAAGFISASQAIRIAYLRGLTAGYAGGPDGMEGAMMAAGTSFDDANDLCALEAFDGRMVVAASNGPDTVTLSGDKDAILEAYEVLVDESRFARILKVDKAYHSHHMRPCAEPYVVALKACGCDGTAFASDAAPRSTWISSVYEGKVMQPSDVNAEYWKDNLLSPVLFSFAVELAAVKNMPLDIGIEVGPHPALKNPTLQTIQNCIGSDLPYMGCMDRKSDDIEAFSSCLGYIWSHLGSAAIDIDRLYSQLSIDGHARDVSKQLPGYSWDHSRAYRRESRALRRLLDAERPHLLLGRICNHSTPSSMHWQNFIRPRDIEWLDGHSLQGQIVFPGAGYIVMAMEAAVKLAGERSIQLFEVLDLKIDKAVIFEDENSMVEINLSLDVDAARSTDTYAVYSFVINSCLAREAGPARSVTGTLTITYGQATGEVLPTAQEEPAHLNDISIEQFYDMLDKVGYNYTKQFRGITTLRRGDSKAHGAINFHRLEDDGRNMVLHPITLDVAFQSMIGAYTAPGDGRIQSLLVPTGIGRIAFNPWVANRISPSSSQVHFTSTSMASSGTKIQGDIEVFDPTTNATMLHIEGIGFKPTQPPLAADDHAMYTQWSLGPLNPDALLDEPGRHATDQDKKDVSVIERVTYWYIRFILANVTAEDREKGSSHFQKYIQWCEYVLAETQAGRNAWHTPDWDNDTREDLEQMIRENISQPFIRLIQRVGEGALDIFRNNENAFDLLDHDGLITEFYSGEVSYGQSYYYYQRILEQLTHRYPNMNVLEVGAGTAGATRLFLNHDGLSFNSYTFTDISRTFFEPAAKEFERHAEKMEFRALDIRRPPAEQGFKPHSYDLIAASNVLHATPNLEQTMANVRSLLKPGGRLLVIEIAHREHTRVGFIFGLFPDWWSGHEDGRVLEPFIPYDGWDKLLKKTGFSGIDTRSLDPDSTTFPSGVFLSRAVNDFTEKLDSPLTAPPEDIDGPLVVVGGSSPKTADLVAQLPGILPTRKWDTVPSLRQIIDADLHPGSTFVVLSELDEHTFEGLDEEKFDALQTIFNAAHHVLWVTEDAWRKSPQQAMTIGLLRTLRHEYPDIQVQVLDVDSIRSMKPHFLVETMLRLELGAKWEDSGYLWTQEPELYLSGGKVLIPRLKRDIERNNRLNSGRRPIVADLNPLKDLLRLSYDDEKPFFGADVERFVPLPSDETPIKIQVQYSLAKALRFGRSGFYHLVLGRNVDSENTIVLALSDSNASQVQVPSHQTIHVGSADDEAKSLLLGISAKIVAVTMMSDLEKGSDVLVFDPPSCYIESLRDEAAAAAVSLTFASTKAAPMSGGIRWIRLHERENERRLLQKLPRNISALYDLASDQNPASLSRRLARCLPPSCSIRRPEYLFQNTATSTSALRSQAAMQILAEAVKTPQPRCNIDEMPVYTAHEIASSKSAPEINAIIDWAADQAVPSRIRPIDAEDLFVGGKTYWLVGLAGDMGRSIARFMVEHGARHLVLSSRVPKIDQRWIDDIARSGGRVMVLPMDVSNEAAVDKGLAEVRASMPPIAGVAFGPLLLQDVLFKNMELSMMEMVLAPKQRRARGMAASTIDIGAVIGVGFISRAGRENESQTRKFLADEVKEWELHSLFAEAVVAGRNMAIDDVELVTGMAHLHEKEKDRIPWYNDPRFAGFQVSDRHTVDSEATGTVGSLKDQLTKAETLEQVRTIILEGVSSRIRGALLFSAGDELNLITPLIDQGVDSLSAVTVASWFSKNLSLDIPVLKILGGASATELVNDAISRLSPSLIPLVDSQPLDDTAQPSTDASPTTPLSTGISPHSPTYSVEQSGGISTPPSQTSESDDGFQRVGPLSIMQEYSWKQMQLPLDPATFNSTIGMYMQGPLDLSRLGWAFDQVLRRSDTFRACFISDPKSSHDRPMQAIMRAPQNSFQAIKVADRIAADEAFKELQGVRYDLEKGDTLKIIDYFWTTTDHLLVIAYHRLVGDGSTTERLFVEASMLYSGLSLEPPPSYVDYAIRQHAQLASGAFGSDLAYWSGLYKTPPPRLPVLSAVPANHNWSGSATLDWTSHEASARLNRMVAVRIRDRSRKQQATPMHFYLASFHILLARMTDIADITIGVADTGRGSLIDQATMGLFASYLPVRLAYDSGHVFNEALSATKEQMRAALLHSIVPLPAILDRLGLPTDPSADNPSSHAPLFQVVFDYRQGQTESGSIGEAKIVETNIPRAGTPYDITLQMGDDPSKGEPLITVKLRKERYGPGAAEKVIQAYLSILNTFARNPVLRVTDATLDQGAKARS
ncbi:putative polyketide synthase [Thozetella sp. PMI_491]|nr:putative polyketide synthase [Thozetella sp. PMI_491]